MYHDHDLDLDLHFQVKCTAILLSMNLWSQTYSRSNLSDFDLDLTFSPSALQCCISSAYLLWRCFGCQFLQELGCGMQTSVLNVLCQFCVILLLVRLLHTGHVNLTHIQHTTEVFLHGTELMVKEWVFNVAKSNFAYFWGTTWLIHLPELHIVFDRKYALFKHVFVCICIGWNFYLNFSNGVLTFILVWRMCTCKEIQTNSKIRNKVLSCATDMNNIW